MAKDDPGYITLSKPIGYGYGLLFIVVVILAIVLPIVTKKDTDDKVSVVRVEKVIEDWKPVEHDQFVEELDPFTLWGTSEKAQEAFQNLDLTGKLGQMSLWDPGLLTGPGLDRDYEQIAKDGGAGTYINVIRYESSTDGEKKWPGTKEYQDLATNSGHIPILFGFDTIHGYSTIFPINLGMSCAWDPTLIETAAQFGAKEMKAEGVVATFAPMVDISRDPRWGRVMESSGEDAYLNGLMGAATVRGFQKENVAACVKHLSAYGLPEAGLDYMATRASTLELHNEFLRSYRMAMMSETLDADPVNQAWMGMASYHIISGKPAHANSELLTDIVRGRWGWKGLMVADYAGVAQLRLQRYVNPLNTHDAVYAAIGAGINQNMADAYYWDFKDDPQMDVGVIHRNRSISDHIDLATKRVIALKDKLGLFDTPIPPTPPDANAHFSAEALQASQTAAEKSAVLLKNVDKALPIQHVAANKYLVVGGIADSTRDILGGWTGVHSKEGYQTELLKANTVTYLQGLKNKLGAEADKTLTYQQGYVYGYDATGERAKRNDAANAAALVELEKTLTSETEYNYVIAIVGEHGISQGETTSRTNLNIAGGQMAVVERLVAYKQAHPNTKLILVYNAGRPLTMLYESLVADAILYMWSPGIRAGNALASLVFGDVSPTGRTTVTFPRSIGQIPIYYGQHPSGRPAQRKIGDPIVQPYPGTTLPAPGFTSDYIDEYNIPLYPFGFGLSYADFSITSREASPRTVNANSKITVTATVTVSDHTVPVSDVVQVYLAHPVSKQSQPKLRLVGFQKLEFAAGVNSATASIEVDVEQHFGFYDTHLDYIVEPGKYVLYVQRDAGEETDGIEITLE